MGAKFDIASHLKSPYEFRHLLGRVDTETALNATPQEHLGAALEVDFSEERVPRDVQLLEERVRAVH